MNKIIYSYNLTNKLKLVLNTFRVRQHFCVANFLKFFNELLKEEVVMILTSIARKEKKKSSKKEVYQEQLSNGGVKLLMKLSNAAHHYTGVYDLFEEHNSLTINLFIQNVS